MAVTVLERGIQILGLQFLFAPILVLTGDGSRKLSAREKQTASSLVRYLDTAIAGAQLHIRRQSGKRQSTQPFTKTIPAERAYRAMQPILPQRPQEARALLRDIRRISRGIAAGRKLNPAAQRRLHSFCHKALNHLDQESFVNAHHSPFWFP